MVKIVLQLLAVCLQGWLLPGSIAGVAFGLVVMPRP